MARKKKSETVLQLDEWKEEGLQEMVALESFNNFIVSLLAYGVPDVLGEPNSNGRGTDIRFPILVGHGGYIIVGFTPFARQYEVTVGVKIWKPNTRYAAHEADKPFTGTKGFARFLQLCYEVEAIQEEAQAREKTCEACTKCKPERPKDECMGCGRTDGTLPARICKDHKSPRPIDIFNRLKAVLEKR